MEENNMNNNETFIVTGIIKEIKEDKIFVTSNKEISILSLNTQSIIWKGKRGKKINDLQENDFFYARGTKKSDDVLLVEIIWANIVNVTSNVQGIYENTLILNNNDNVDLDPDIDLIEEGSNVKVLAKEGVVQKGDFIQVIGLLDQKSNRIKATKIFRF